MPNPFINKNVFNPNLAAEVAAAYERNRQAELTPGDPAGNIGVQSLADIVRGDTAEAKEIGSAGLADFDQISNPDTREAFEVSFTVTEQLFGRIDIAVPTPEDCGKAGSNLGALGAAYERMQREDLEPQIVLAPGLDLDSWKRLYQNLTDDLVTNKDPTILENDSLVVIDPNVLRHWKELMALPDGVPCIRTAGEELTWSLRLIPGTSEAPCRGYYSETTNPVVAEYLSLQAARLQAGQEPLDNLAPNWLDGSYSADNDSNVRAPTGYWARGRVNKLIIYWSYDYDVLHRSRPPVWT